MNTIIMNKIMDYLMLQLINNCPVRTKPLGKLKYSPFPGNLRKNGINITLKTPTLTEVTVGGPSAPYGPYTETMSHSPGWMEKSMRDTQHMIARTYGGRVK